MRRRCYSLFLALTISSLFIILIVTMKEEQWNKISHEKGAECEWKMMQDPAMLSSNHARWNESLLLSLGLLAPKTSYVNGSRISNQSKPRCSGYENQIQSQKMLKEMSSDANLLCQTLRNLTGSAESCYNLDNYHLNKFLDNEYGLNKTWRCFHPPDVNSRILTTLQIYKAIRFKRLPSKPTIITPMSDVIRSKNSTFIYRIFVLIESLHPMRFFIFKKGMILLDQESWLLPFEFDSSHDQVVYNLAVRWIHLYLDHVKMRFPANEFKHIVKYGQVSKVVVADFQPTSTGMQLLRIHDNVQQLRSKSTPHSLNLFLHKILTTSIQYLLIRHSSSSANQLNSILNGTYYEEIFGLISSLIIDPFIPLEPAFQPRWTHYTATVPYEMILLNVQLVLNNAALGATLENESAKNFNVSVGLGWNDFRIKVSNKDPQIRPIMYILKIRRLHRPDNPQLFHTNLSVCILEQECNLQFKEKVECGLQASPFGNWSSALTNWDRLQTCPFSNSEGAWMVPCSSCLLERSCYWSRARWQPFECQYPLYSPSKLKQCLFDRKLIFVGDSTNRGMMESLLERLDGWLTTSDSTKWHSYRHRIAGRTQFHFDYYPKFWMSTRTSLEQTLVHILRRAEAGANDTTLIIGGLDWMSTQHFDTIQQVLAKEGLSEMAVVIKMAGAGFQSDGRREDPVSTASRLGRLSRTARLHYGFRTIDTWNMTAAKFRDFLPGRCRCHFHQITEVNESDADSVADAIASSPRRFRTDGPINQAYTEILADQLCRNELLLQTFVSLQVNCQDKMRPYRAITEIDLSS